jgi:hypothetical protein
MADNEATDLAALLSAADTIQKSVDAMLIGLVSAGECLRQLNAKLIAAGFPSRHRAGGLLAGEDASMANVLEAAADVNIRARRACEIQKAVGGRTPGHA